MPEPSVPNIIVEAVNIVLRNVKKKHKLWKKMEGEFR